MARALKRFLPLFDRVLVERFAPEAVSKGGVLIPEKAQEKVVLAKVVSVGPGTKNNEGVVQSVSVKAGDTVLLPEYGGVKVMLEDKEYHLFRDGDILGMFEDS